MKRFNLIGVHDGSPRPGGDEDGCSNAHACDKVQDGRLKNSKKAKQTNLTSNNSNTLLTDCNESFLVCITY